MKNDSPVPEDVREFLIDHIDSVAQLEALLLLRQGPHQEWDIPAVSKRLYINESKARTILSGLVASNLVTTDGENFKFSAGETDQQCLNALALCYAQYLVPVTQIIHGKASSVIQFANAFKLRKDK